MKTSLTRFVANENLNDATFYDSLIEELNKMMEDELNKHYEDINAELIEDCCNALTAIYEIQNGESQNTANITNINSVIRKYNILNRRKYITTAACAAVAFFTLGLGAFTFKEEIIKTAETVKSAFSQFEQIFNEEEPPTEETTSPPVTNETTQQHSEQTTLAPLSTEEVREIQGIAVITPEEFDATVSKREEISLENFSVSVNYTNGQKDIVPISAATYEISETGQDGLTEIKVYYNGFTSSVYVTVIPDEKLNPITVTSIYGTFENEYSVEDMKVFAVFSDGTQKKLPKSDCIITTEEISENGKTDIIVTVEYENCCFQFLNKEDVL